MARTKRYREYIARTLKEEGPLATGEIMEKMIDHFRDPPVMQQLVNILSKDKKIHRHGFTRARGLSGSYITMVWAHTSLYSNADSSEEE